MEAAGVSGGHCGVWVCVWNRGRQCETQLRKEHAYAVLMFSIASCGTIRREDQEYSREAIVFEKQIDRVNRIAAGLEAAWAAN